MKVTVPYLSIVVTSRNDNHGGDLLFRMQYFVSSAIEQCNRFELPAELIIIEWNPPDNRQPLAKALTFPNNNSYCKVRIITVPDKEHLKLKHSDKLPLFQMIGKNVGIRRAKGEYILATNIDIILSDEVMYHIKHKLKPGYSYRVDRLDVKKDLPRTSSVAEILKFCKENVLYTHTRFGSFKVNNSINIFPPSQKSPLAKALDYFKRSYSKNPFIFARNLFVHLYAKIIFLLAPFFLKLNRSVPIYKTINNFFLYLSKFVFKIHSNACGDFTLLSTKDWFQLRGYPEWQLYSWHIDGIFLYQARQHGLKEVDLISPIYHIDHEGGFITSRPEELFKQLDEKGIGYISNSELDKMIAELENSGSKTLFNDEHWGLENLPLEETAFFETPILDT